MNPAHGTFYDVAFVFQPGKKAGKNPPYVINISLAALTCLLVLGQIVTQIIRPYMRYVQFDRSEHSQNRSAVSYTHLREILYQRGQLHQLHNVADFAGDVTDRAAFQFLENLTACLLYTSRCV